MSGTQGTNLIYGLIDPRTLLIRYIGQTTQGMSRPKAHQKQGSSGYCKNWIANLKHVGLTYEITVLEQLDDPSDLDQAEQWWISFGRACGWPLTNLTPGGSLSEPERRERQIQKALGNERRARDRVAREQRKVDSVAEDAAADYKRRLDFFSLIAKHDGVSVEVLEAEYQFRNQWRPVAEAVAKGKLLQRLQRAQQEHEAALRALHKILKIRPASR